MVEIVKGDPTHPQVVKLLKQSHALMARLFPPESCHYLSFNALRKPHIRFFVALKRDGIIGCGALAMMQGYGELKSIFVDQAHRGEGIATLLVQHLIDVAHSEGYCDLYLETGHSLYAAVRMYEKFGFKPCRPFGDYKEDPNSLFMHLAQ